MTPWQIHYPTNLPFKYAVKNYNGTVKGYGYVHKGDVLLDDKNKTLFTKEEWETVNFDIYLINMISTFKGKLLTDKVNTVKVFDRSKL